MTPTTLPGHVPAVLADGQTHELGHHLSTEVTSITIGLRLRNQPALDQFLQDVNNPSSPRYHHFMTQDEANQPFDPTPDEEQRVVSWLRANGLRVTNTYPNHLLVDAQGTFGQIEQLLHVTLNDYQAPVHGKERVFFAPASDPAVDSSVADAVQSIIGLDNYPRFHRHTNGRAAGSAPYYPQNFADAYDVNPLWNAGYDGSGQHIGITLWTVPPSDSTLQSFGLATGANVPTTANGRLKVFLVDGGTNSTISPDDGEAGMDIEYSSAMAPRAIVDYYEAPTDSSGNPTDQGLLDALNQAGTDSNNNRQITNSWGGCEASAASDPWTVSAENIFSSNAATGHNYLFSSGDNGSWCDPTGNGTGQDPYPDYPASSPHVTAVGGTTFNANVSGRYPGESAWMYCPSAPTPCNSYTASSPEGSGGGYSKIFGRPSWQIGGGLPSNGARGYPDVSAAADPNTGAYVCYGATSACGQFGGTSLASPLWAGMLALVNQYLAAQGKASAGFVDPILYSLATHTQTYAPFHDITSGTNGAYNACPQWDAVTGWGSPDLFNLAQDIANPSGGSRSIGSSSCNQIYTRVSMRQYTLTGSDGNTWTDMDTSNLVLTITPGADSAITLSANADLWTSSAGYNQDLGIVVSGGGYTGIVAWKESGGAASYSPNAAFVHAVLSLQAGTTYTIKLQWKANRADPGTIAAGAGPLNGQFSPTRLTAEVAPLSAAPETATSTQQYALTGSNGSTWTDMDPANLSLSLTPASSCTAVLSANADLWTSSAGYNQDLGIVVSGGGYTGIVAWKESGGAASYSPNAAFVHAVLSLQAGTTYTIKLQWKANRADAGTIWAGAGPDTSGQYSPARLSALCSSTSSVSSRASTQQYALTGSNGSTWTDMDPANLSLSLTPASSCTAVLSANADLWTSSAGYNQDLGIVVSGGGYTGIVAWKESGGAASYSPNAAFVHAVLSLQAGTTYTIKLQWKANRADAGTIAAGAGPLNGQFSPTRLTVEC